MEKNKQPQKLQLVTITINQILNLIKCNIRILSIFSPFFVSITIV